LPETVNNFFREKWQRSAAVGSAWQRVAARGSGADGKGVLSQKQVLGLRPWQ
jgi:hypothetical protein